MSSQGRPTDRGEQAGHRRTAVGMKSAASMCPCGGCAIKAEKASAARVSYCECYGEPEGSPLCDECKAEERERDEERADELFEEDVRLYGI